MITVEEHIQNLTEMGLFTKSGGINPQIRRNKEKFDIIYKYILLHTNFLPINRELLERVYCLKNNINKTTQCFGCEGDNVSFFDACLGYAKYCSRSCASKSELIRKETELKIIETNLRKYGVEHNFQSHQSQEKRTQTTIDKYGVKYHAQKHLIDIIPLLQDYNWIYNQYIIQNKTVVQISKELKVGVSTMCNYLSKHKIDVKHTVRSSRKCIVWLNQIMINDNIVIQHATNGGEYQIINTKYKADGYCEDTNTIYEFYGDYWHGNPSKFSSDYYNKSMKTTMGDLYQKTIDRENIIKSLGYNLITIWELDFKY